MTNDPEDLRVRQMGEKALMAFILSLSGIFLPVVAIISIFVGFSAFDEIDTERLYERATPRNAWMARAAIVIGFLVVVGWVIVLVFVFFVM